MNRIKTNGTKISDLYTIKEIHMYKPLRRNGNGSRLLTGAYKEIKRQTQDRRAIKLAGEVQEDDYTTQGFLVANGFTCKRLRGSRLLFARKMTDENLYYTPFNRLGRHNGIKDYP